MRGRVPGEADPRGRDGRRVRRALRAGAAAALLAALALPGPAATPVAGAAPAADASTGLRAAASCTGWTSETAPPETIRVLRTAGPAQDTVQVVPFRDYVEVVMATEWGASNPAEALRAGAVAVKEYAWLKAMTWRGKKGPDGECYDIVDSSMDQVYAPEKVRPVPPTLVAAVADTWGTTVMRDGRLFTTHYQGGKKVACGADADGVWLYQNSAMACARDGKLAAEILTTYYAPDVTVVGATDPTGPAPSPTPTPSPSPSAVPASALAIRATASATTWPGNVRLSATLSAAEGGATGSGRTIRFESSPDMTTWTSVGEAPTSESGAASVTRRPVATLWYRAVFDGAEDLGVATSDPVRVTIRQWLRLVPDRQPTASALPGGTVVTCTAIVRPARSDAAAGVVTLEVARKVGTGWKVTSSEARTPDAKGLAAFSVTLDAPGTWRIRARAAATERNAASAWSPPQVWTVR